MAAKNMVAITTKSRKKKVMTMATTIERLLEKGEAKFGSEFTQIVTADDGIEIDEDEVLCGLSDKLLMLLKDEEEWEPETVTINASAGNTASTPGIAPGMGTSQGQKAATGPTQGMGAVMTTNPDMTSTVGTTVGTTTAMGATPGMTTAMGATSGMTTAMGAMPGMHTAVGATPGMNTAMGATSGMTTAMGDTPRMHTAMGATPGMAAINGATPVMTTVMGTTPVITGATGATPGMEVVMGGPPPEGKVTKIVQQMDPSQRKMPPSELQTQARSPPKEVKEITKLKPKQKILPWSVPVRTNGKKVNRHVRLDESQNPGGIIVKNLGSSSLKGLKNKERVILVVGATGCGKSTWINALFNYAVGVEYEDDFRFKLVTDEGGTSQAHSQTQHITIYTLHHMDGMAVDFTLTIVDTPGFGDTRGIAKDKHIEQQLRGIFDAKKGGIDHLDAVGFVIQSSAARLTQTQKYIFDSILALFGQDIGENIFLLFTFADAKKPQALSAVKEDGMPYQKFFKFNNSAIFDDVGASSGGQGDDDDEEDPAAGSFDQLFWEIGMNSFGKFLACLKNISTKSLSLTRDVLHRREHLEKHVEHLHQQVTRGIHMFEQLREEENLLHKSLEDIESSKEFTVMREEVNMDKEPLAGDTHTTTCLICNYTCHEDCIYKNDEEKMNCAAMDQSKQPPCCGYCPNRCPWDQHRNLPFIIVYTTTMKEVTIDDIKERYEKATGEKLSKEQIINKVQDDLDAMEAQIKSNLSEITVSLEKLNQIALRTNHLSQIEYLDLLIQFEKDQGKPGWKKRVQGLLAFRDKAQALYDIAQGKYDPFGQYRQEADKARQGNNNMQHLSVWLNVANNVKNCLKNAMKPKRSHKLFA